MNASFLFGFLTGCLVSFIGRYGIQVIFNQRTLAEHIDNRNNTLHLLFQEYADFINLIQKNLHETEHKNTKEFFVVDKAALMSSATPRLRIDLSAEVLPILDRLEELEQIEKISHDSLLYKMDDRFIARVKAFEKNTLNDTALTSSPFG